jgi:hypothetical protein
MPPDEVMERFSEEDMIRMVAYGKLYGPPGPERLDILFARLGMDVIAPHLKKGKSTKLEDHKVMWGQKKQTQTPQDILAAAQNITAQFKRQEKAAQRRKQAAQQRREKQRAAHEKQTPSGGRQNRGASAPRPRSRPRPARKKEG